MKRILVSGAAGKLGQVVVQHFAEAGFDVLGTVRKLNPASHVNTNVEYVAVDLENESETESFVTTCIQKKGPIQVAALLAGGFAMGDIVSTSYAAIDHLVASNFRTAYALIRPLFMQMQSAGGGTIFLIGSRSAVALASGKNLLAYTLSKSLLLSLAEILNEAGKDHKVAVHVFVPGTIDTPANREAMPSADFSTWVNPAILAKAMIDISQTPFTKDSKRVHHFY